MKKYTGHTEEWGSFVDVKINAPELLRKEKKKEKERKCLDIGSMRPISTN